MVSIISKAFFGHAVGYRNQELKLLGTIVTLDLPGLETVFTSLLKEPNTHTNTVSLSVDHRRLLYTIDKTCSHIKKNERTQTTVHLSVVVLPRQSRCDGQRRPVVATGGARPAPCPGLHLAGTYNKEIGAKRWLRVKSS